MPSLLRLRSGWSRLLALVWACGSQRGGIETLWLRRYKPSTPKPTIFRRWLGWQDSNLRMAASKAAALPLGDTPIFWPNILADYSPIFALVCGPAKGNAIISEGA